MFVYIFQDNWRTIITYASCLYMLFIFGGQQYMSGRPRMEMRGALCLWNITLGRYALKKLNQFKFKQPVLDQILPRLCTFPFSFSLI